MSKKIIHKVSAGPGPSAKVYKDYEWEQFVVKLYDDQGHYLPKSDYFTGDKEDAIETAKGMVAMQRSRSPQHTRMR